MKFPVGAILAGTFSASDEHFDSIGIAVEGTAYSATTPGGNPRWTITGATAYPAASTSGTSGTWEFDTAGMPACGYVLRAIASRPHRRRWRQRLVGRRRRGLLAGVSRT